MAWVAPAIMAAGSIAGSMMNSGDSKSGGQPMYAMANMPPWLQDKFNTQLQGMPTGMNIGFGGQQYPVMYKPTLFAAESLYKPTGAIPYQSPAPSALTGAMTAAAPYAWMMASQPRDPYPQPNYDFTGASNNYGMPYSYNVSNVQPYYPPTLYNF